MSKIADRAILVLSMFTLERPRLSVEELTRLSGLPVSTIYRFLQGLLKSDFLAKDGYSQTYRLGPAMLRLARVAEAGLDFRSLAIPWMEKLWEKTGETIYLSVRLGDSWLVVENRERRGGIKFSIHPGDTGPLYAGSTGKVLLAYLKKNELKKILDNARLVKITPKTVTNRKKLLNQLTEIWTRGYCYTEEEYNPGAWGLAAPVFNSHGVIEAALTISGVLDKKSENRITGYLKLLLEATRDISKKLGFSNYVSGGHSLLATRK